MVTESTTHHCQNDFINLLTVNPYAVYVETGLPKGVHNLSCFKKGDLNERHRAGERYIENGDRISEYNEKLIRILGGYKLGSFYNSKNIRLWAMYEESVGEKVLEQAICKIRDVSLKAL